MNEPMTPVRPPRESTGGRIAWVAAALALAAVALAIATQFSIGRDAGVPDARFGFIAAVVLLFVAAALLTRAPTGRQFELPRWLEWRLVLVVIGVALLFRIYHFFSFPPGLWYDEAVNGTDALALMMHGNHLDVWKTTNNGHSTIYFYLLIASFKLFGYTILAMRIVPVLAGLAAVAVFYLLARELMSSVASLVAMALMAVSRYAVTFSRISWEASLEPLLEILAVYFFVRAIKTGRRFHWVMAGGSLAAGLYTYAAFRFIPFVMAFFVLYVLATRAGQRIRRASHALRNAAPGTRFGGAGIAVWRDFRRHLPGLVLYFVAFCIVLAPLGQFVIRHTHDVTARQNEVSVFSETSGKSSAAMLWDNVQAVAKMMNVRGDANARHNLPGEPMLDEISAALLVLGAGVAVWSIRDWRRGGILGWYAITLAASALTLTWENPSAIRSIGVIPPMFLLIGLAVEQLQRALAGDTLRRGAFSLAVVALVVWAGAINFHVLFDHQAKNQQVFDMFQSQGTAAAETVADDAGHASVYFNDSFFGPATDLLDHGKKFSAVEPASDVPVPVGSGKDTEFVLDDNQVALERYLVALYPDAKADEVRDRWGRISYIVVRIPASAVTALHQAKAEYASPGGARTSVAEESQLSHTWPQDRPDGLSYPFTLSWSGLIRLNPQVDQRLLVAPMQSPTRVELSSPGPVHLEIEGIGALDGSGNVGLNIPPGVVGGLYRFRATALVVRDGVTKLQWQLPGTLTQIVPPDALVLDAPAPHGFLARHYQGADWSGPVVLRSYQPYAIPLPWLQPKYSVAMDGRLNITRAGTYGFADYAEWPVGVLVDGKLVVDGLQPEGWRRVEGSIYLSAGPHTVTIKYASVGRTSFHIEWQPPGSGWRVFTGQEVTPPPIAPGGG